MKNNNLTISYQDFLKIKSDAINIYRDIKFPIKIGDRELEQSDFASYSVALAMINYLNGNNALNRDVDFKQNINENKEGEE